MRRLTPAFRMFSSTLAVTAMVTVHLHAPRLAIAASQYEGHSSPILIQEVLGEGEEVRAKVERDLLSALDGEDLSTPDGQPLSIVVSESLDDPGSVRVEFFHAQDNAHEWTCRCSALELQEQLPSQVLEALRKIRTEAQPPEPSVVAPRPSLQSVESGGESPDWDEKYKMMDAGLILTAIGLPIASGGAGTMVFLARTGRGDRRWSIGLIATGGVLMAVGIPLAIVGHRRSRNASVASLRLVPWGQGLGVLGTF